VARTLFHTTDCPYCAKVRRGLELDGVEYDSRLIDDDDRSEVVKVSGQPKVPVFVEEDGTVIGGSNPILNHLASREGSTLLPPSRRDQTLTWLIVDRADSVLRPLTYHLLHGKEPEGGPLSEDDIAVLERRLKGELAVIEGLLERGPHLFGDSATVADIGTHVYLARLPETLRDSLLKEFPRVAGWYSRL